MFQIVADQVSGQGGLARGSGARAHVLQAERETSAMRDHAVIHHTGPRLTAGWAHQRSF
jgi:hypothetical protein